MLKTLDLANGDKYMFTQDDELISITKYFLNNNELEKTLLIQFYEDFFIDAYVVNEEQAANNCITFEIKEGEPLYLPLSKFLGNNPRIIIDDDLTRPETMKFAQIYRNNSSNSSNSSIFITIKNKLKNSTVIDKYNICVNNMMYDGDSKIDKYNYDTKVRIRALLKSACEEFVSDSLDDKVVVKQLTYKK